MKRSEILPLPAIVPANAEAPTRAQAAALNLIYQVTAPPPTAGQES